VDPYFTTSPVEYVGYGLVVILLDCQYFIIYICVVIMTDNDNNGAGEHKTEGTDTTYEIDTPSGEKQSDCTKSTDLIDTDEGPGDNPSECANTADDVDTHNDDNILRMFRDVNVPNYHLIAKNILHARGDILDEKSFDNVLRHPEAAKNLQATTWEGLTSLCPKQPVDSYGLDHYLQCTISEHDCPGITTTHQFLEATTNGKKFCKDFKDIKLNAMVTGQNKISHYSFSIIFPPRKAKKVVKHPKNTLSWILIPVIWE